MNHGAALSCDCDDAYHENMDASWLTPSKPPSSTSPPRPLPFEYTSLTLPIHLPIDPQTFFYLQLITHSPNNFDSDSDIIPKLFHKYYH